MKYTVYIHKFPNGKVYIGITSKNVKRRWCRGSTYSYHKRMYNAIKKYGWDNIEHLVLFDNMCKDEAEKKEKELILHYKSYLLEFGYNRDMGGNVSGKVSDESKNKMRMAKLGTKRSPEFCDMIKKVHTGNSYRKGAVLSVETKRKMSESKIGKTCNARKIDQLDLKGNLIKTWDSILSVERELGFNNSSIVNNLKNRSKTSYNFKWVYHE